MTPWADFARRVMASLQEVPDEVAIDACREAGKFFARKTQLLKADLEAIDIVADQDEYDLPFEQGAFSTCDVDYAGAGVFTFVPDATLFPNGHNLSDGEVITIQGARHYPWMNDSFEVVVSSSANFIVRIPDAEAVVDDVAGQDNSFILNDDPTFDDPTKWTQQEGTGWTVASGVASCNGTAGFLVQKWPSLATGLKRIYPNVIYDAQFDVLNYVSGELQIDVGGWAGSKVTANGSYRQQIKTGAENNELGLKSRSISGFVPFDGEVDNFNLSESARNWTIRRQERIVSPVYVEFDGSPVYPLSESHADHVSPRWRIGGGPFLRYHMLGPNRIKLTWTPTKAITGGLKVRAIVAPNDFSTHCDDRLFEDWAKEIEAGAIADLLMQPDKPWSAMRQTSPTGRWAQVLDPRKYQIQFENGISEARMVAEKSRTNSSTRVQMRPFA